MDEFFLSIFGRSFHFFCSIKSICFCFVSELLGLFFLCPLTASSLAQLPLSFAIERERKRERERSRVKKPKVRNDGNAAAAAASDDGRCSFARPARRPRPSVGGPARGRGRRHHRGDQGRPEAGQGRGARPGAPRREVRFFPNFDGSKKRPSRRQPRPRHLLSLCSHLRPPQPHLTKTKTPNNKQQRQRKTAASSKGSPPSPGTSPGSPLKIPASTLGARSPTL